MSDWRTLRDRTAGKWQIPLLLASIALLGLGVYRLAPPAQRLPLTQALPILQTLVDGGLHERAIELGERLLQRPDEPPSALAYVHLLLARAKSGFSKPSGSSADWSQQILTHYREAAANDVPMNGADWERQGRELEALGRFTDAVASYEQALSGKLENPLDLRRRVLDMRRVRLGESAELLAPRMDQFLDDVGEDRLDLRLWAIEEKLHALEATERMADASTLLAREQTLFVESSLRDRFEYLNAWLYFQTGLPDQAEVLLRTIRSRVDDMSAENAMSGWLLGRVALRDDGPQRPMEAISFFTDVINRHRFGPYVVASRVGLAEALSLMERHDEAIRAYGVAVDELASQSDGRLVNLDVIRVSMLLQAERLRKEGAFRQAADYALLATRMVEGQAPEQVALAHEQAARLCALVADAIVGRDSTDPREDSQAEIAVSPDARSYYRRAAELYLEIGRMSTLDDERGAQASWEAGELLSKAGETDRALEAFRRFATEYPTHSHFPRALLRLGQLQQRMGRMDDAIASFQDCYRRFPRSLDGFRALVPLARCYLFHRAGDAALAEKTLRIVLEGSEVFTPDAPEFAEALFLLGDVLMRQGEFERAIGSLEEALERYPSDDRVWRTRYLLGDANRRSALALKSEAAETSTETESRRGQEESLARLASAREQFRRVIERYEASDPAALSALERVYLRHAALYEADCYFEAQDYSAALKLYEESASVYRDHPAGLAAYVRIIQCETFLGRPGEARAALSRALVMADAMPQDAFRRSVSPETRADWKRYLQWLGQSELF